MNLAVETLATQLAKSLRPSFRGEIWDNCARFKLLGKAYEAMPPEQNGHFRIESARHLAGPLRALKDPAVRMVFIIGATQCLKSVAGDIWTLFVLEHVQRNMLVLFEDDKKAKEYADIRLMDSVRRHPSLASVIADIDRHSVTKTQIKFPGMDLLVGGLNEGNVSTLSWPLIWVSESWQHQSDGMLRKAIKRADRFPDDCKILIESQPGLADEDLEVETRPAVKVPLEWACPFCGGRQTWETPNEFGRLRPEDFQPRPVPGVEPPRPGTYSGMKFPPAEDASTGIVRVLTIAERAAAAAWECYWCGTLIRDTEQNRRRIMDSYSQEYRVNGVSPRAVCFHLPFESAVGNRFEKTVASYLTAKESQRLGNLMPLQNWYLQERAIFYDADLTRKEVFISVGSYDPNQVVADEHSRNMTVDAQKHAEKDTVGTFWYVVRVWDKFGNSWQLARGFASSWDELYAVQSTWKIPNARVCIDSSRWTPQIMVQVANHYEEVDGFSPLLMRRAKYKSCWRLFFGDDARAFRVKSGSPGGASAPVSDGVPTQPMIVYDRHGQKLAVTLFKYRWSNLMFELQLESLLDQSPGVPKFHVLGRERLDQVTLAREVGDLTYDRQMKARSLGEERGRQKFLDLPNRQAHYRDCELMQLVRAAQDGLLGHAAAPPESDATR